TAGELGRDLERFLSGDQVRARPPGKLGRLWRRLKHNKFAVVAGLLLLLLPVLGLAEKARRDAQAHAVQEELDRKEAEKRRREADVAAEAIAPMLSGAAPKARALALGAAIALANKDLERAHSLAEAAHQAAPDDIEAMTVRGLTGLARNESEATTLLAVARGS